MYIITSHLCHARLTPLKSKVLDGQMKHIEDTFADDGRCTTDGCCPIRESCAKEIRTELDLPSSTSGKIIHSLFHCFKSVAYMVYSISY